MGQSASQPRRSEEDRRNRRRSILRQSIRHSIVDDGQAGLLRAEHSVAQSSVPPRPHNRNRLSQLLRPSSRADVADGEPLAQPRGPFLQRTRSTFREMLSSRENTHMPNAPSSSSTQGNMQHRASYVRAGMSREGNDYYPPRLPSIDISSGFDSEPFPVEGEPEEPPRSSNSNRRSNLRFNALRPDRPFRHITSSFRRRRSSQPSSLSMRAGGEDQATMLSRLLSAAAAATAATLMGDDHQALGEARSLTGEAVFGDLGGNGEDGSFDGFLRALQNGRIASALRQGSDPDGDSAPRDGPLNIFRMFRFGAADSNTPVPLSPGSRDSSEAGENVFDGRMVPIIIIGIRSINSSSGSRSGSAAEELPAFIDALGNFPSPLPAAALGTHGHESIDSILRPPQNGTSFRHRRRASMGGFGMGRSRISDRYDDQRDHRSPDRRRDRPWSIASANSVLEPRPPPATPASPSPELSRIPSRNSTPNHSRPPSFVANSMRDFISDSTRNSTLHRSSAASPLTAHTEETSSLHSTHSSANLLPNGEERGPFRFDAHRRSDTAPNIHYPRFASGHPRRNGVVEPDHLPPLSRSSTSNATDNSSNNIETRGSNNDSRSWIIYVLGGSYPENHPILTTPSLFTENPTYEDMMLLSALLGPAKAPVATEEDVEEAGGVYNIEASNNDAAKTAELVAVATEGGERVELEVDQRCLVCLCNFEVAEVCRKLVKCNHLFHKDCIDQWLTQGRNSCPLCRGQGVDEREKPSDDADGTRTPDGSPSAPAELEAESSQHELAA